MTSEPLRVEQHGPVRWLTMNRPAQRNAFNRELVDAFAAQVDDIADDPNTAVVVVTGEGPSFSAGGDFRHFLAVDEGVGRGVADFLTYMSSVFAKIDASPKPWVAALHGHVIAGGLELALVCDVVIAAEGTQIGDGHLNNKLLPGAGSSVRLERAVGKSFARWMHLSGETLSAEQLTTSGWILDVVPQPQLQARASAAAATLAQRDRRVQRNFKELLTEIREMNETAALTREIEAFQSNWNESDVPSALREFLEARTRNKTGGSDR